LVGRSDRLVGSVQVAGGTSTSASMVINMTTKTTAPASATGIG
jgi:hypothetical protein